MIKKYEWTVRENISNKKCLICQKEFKKGDKFVMVPIQEPSGDFFINSIAIQIHTKCYYVDKEK